MSANTPRLSIMMFLQFFAWGSWYVTIGNFMIEGGMSDLTFWPYTGNAIAAILSPFIIGLVADRFFNSEKVMFTLHLLGGITMLIVPGLSDQPQLFLGAIMVYNICYMPTLGLANSIAFHHIENQEKQFPIIRLFGTVGWIMAGFFISFVLGQFSGEMKPDITPMPFYTSGITSLLLAVYALTLPKTPPKGKDQPVSVRSIMGVDAFQELKSRPFVIFLVSSLLICIPLAAYYNFAPILIASTSFENPAATMSIGQMSEVMFLLLMPLLFVRLGVKKMLLFGMLAWVIRYMLFALGAPDSVQWMMLIGVALHGICYDFFFVTGQIYVDKKSSDKIRGQAQGFLVLVTYGVGMLIGAQIAGKLFNGYLGDQQNLTLEQWGQFWWVPALFALGVTLFFTLTFRDDQVENDRELKSVL
jgi:nucleoside transporter